MTTSALLKQAFRTDQKVKRIPYHLLTILGQLLLLSLVLANGHSNR